MRLIDAEHLKSWIIARWSERNTGVPVFHIRREYPLKAIEILDQIDREDTYDIKHAYWQKSRYRDDTYLCSECGSSFAVGDKLRRYNYCPYCGAKMDKVE